MNWKQPWVYAAMASDGSKAIFDIQKVSRLVRPKIEAMAHHVILASLSERVFDACLDVFDSGGGGSQECGTHEAVTVMLDHGGAE